MATRNGKISQLPPLIQEELNARLFRDELGSTILSWLNKNPHVIAALRGHFADSVISPQNLSEWRQGGYLQWLVQNRNAIRQRSRGESPAAESHESHESHESPASPASPASPEFDDGPNDEDAIMDEEAALRRAQAAERNAQKAQAERQERAAANVRRAGRPTSSDEFHDQIDALYEDAAELGDDVIRAKDLLHVITARYAELLQDWGKVPEADFDRRMETLQHLTKNIAVVRRLEQNDERLDFLREKERNKSKSASSRSSRAPSTRESAPKNRADSQPASDPAAGASQCGAGFQPASAPASTNSAPNHQSAPSSTPSNESDPSNTNPAQDPGRIPKESDLQIASAGPECSQHASSASEILTPPTASVPAPNKPPQSHPIPPTNYSQFPSNSKDRRSRFGLL